MLTKRKLYSIYIATTCTCCKVQRIASNRNNIYPFLGAFVMTKSKTLSVEEKGFVSIGGSILGGSAS
ncbi:hypothetical protein [Bacillus sp. T33-2]|uniref:hypothetical protein n=1 Tax=Bacillus sp. T33-2 TaxID=2054168 RepID=UPI000C773D0B|nr:hypothetical protein [Bacillus sp. T33-2]PLR95929.1 hypothetical protein CVD19_12975 [Bacillus sp. T33-2]